MRLVEMLQVSAAILAVLASAFMAIEGRLVSLSVETAIAIPRVRILMRWRLSKLKALRAFVVVDAHHLYLDEERYRVLRKKRAFLGVLLVLLTLAVVVLVHGLLN
jgi:hypothetical protein